MLRSGNQRKQNTAVADPFRHLADTFTATEATRSPHHVFITDRQIDLTQALPYKRLGSNQFDFFTPRF